MLADIKKSLIDNPDKLIEVLKSYDFAHIRQHRSYISFARDEDGSAKSIVIRLENNDGLYVKDYPLNLNCDLFAYLQSQRNVSFKDVLFKIKDILGFSSFENHYHKPCGAFGGFYDSFKRTKDYEHLKIYSESVLDKYDDDPNLRFLIDHISVDTQKKFGVRFDSQNDAIVIPIHSEVGELIGIKERTNKDEYTEKYWYKIPCSASQTLYGYAQNYPYLVNNDIYIFEAEKSVMQCDSYGIHNVVGLGSGEISRKQIQMILQANPKSIVFLHDNNYKIEAILNNINQVKDYTRLTQSIPIGYWDWTQSIDRPSKCSPSDLGVSALKEIIQNEIKYV